MTRPRRHLPSVAEQLQQEPYRFDFFQAVRVLERSQDQRQSVGGDGRPEDEIVRFRAHPSLVFPPSAIVDLVAPREAHRPPEMVVAFMGLTGPSAALPRYYTELLLERLKQKDTTLRDFLDLFNHRLTSLFYAAWVKHRFWVNFERAERAGRAKRQQDARQYRSFVMHERPKLDLVSQCLLDVCGLGEPTLRYSAAADTELTGRTSLADGTLRYYCGLLAQQRRSAVGLEGLLADYFGVPVAVRQFVGQWLQLGPEDQTQLVPGGNCALGVSTIAGERCWSVQTKFRIRLGPLGYRQFSDFLPPGTAFPPLADLVRLYAGAEHDIDVQLVLKAAEVPWCQLGGAAADGARLGWNTWIRSGPLPRDAQDAVFAIHDATG